LHLGSISPNFSCMRFAKYLPFRYTRHAQHMARWPNLARGSFLSGPRFCLFSLLKIRKVLAHEHDNNKISGPSWDLSCAPLRYTNAKFLSKNSLKFANGHSPQYDVKFFKQKSCEKCWWNRPLMVSTTKIAVFLPRECAKYPTRMEVLFFKILNRFQSQSYKTQKTCFYNNKLVGFWQNWVIDVN
jgi:hypothetical protein